MATRSTIAVQTADGKVRQVYCHWDGYLSWNGKRLLEHHNSLAAALALVEHGDMSTLGTYNTPKGEHSFDAPEDDCTIYYGRDRGETGTEYRVFKDIQSFEKRGNWQEYDYIWRDGAWYVIDFKGGRYVCLDLAVEQDTKEAKV